MRHTAIVLAVLLGSTSPAFSQVSVGIGVNLPGVSIGINLPAYPQLVAVPGYPVYYAPQVRGNYFFYDGLYWVCEGDDWYSSSWYNGPWNRVGPDVVPLYVLRVPVRYYRDPPPYFRGWRADAPPRWGDHWGPQWQQRRSGWDHWDRRQMPAPAPLASYQRQYSGERYPAREQQPALQERHYRYQPRDADVRQPGREHEVAAHERPTAQRPPDKQIPEQRGNRRDEPRGRDNGRENGRDNGRDNKGPDRER